MKKRKILAGLLSMAMTAGSIFTPITTAAAPPETPAVSQFQVLKKGGPLVPGDAYVSGLKVQQVLDGTPGFDGDNEPGNDSDPQNGIVRSFDSIQYTLSYTTAMKETSSYAWFDEGDVYVRFTLPVSSREATFDLGAMSWLLEPELKEENGQVILTGRRHLTKGTAQNAIPGAGTLSVVVKVRAMANQAALQPSFEVWMDGDDTVQTVRPDPVTVSAAPNFNVALTSRSYKSGNGEFDPETGTIGSGTYGRLSGFGLMLQVKSSDPSKGLKGIELPKGPISFRLKVHGYKLDNVTEHLEEMPVPQLWDYKANDQESKTGYLGRALAQHAEDLAWCPMIPQAKGSGKDSCTDSGKWSMTQKGDTITVTVSDYRFSEDLSFPTVSAGRYSASDGIFSTGYLVLFEELERSVPNNTAYYLTLEDSSLQATSVTDQKLPEISDNSNQTDLDDDRVTTQTFDDPPGGSSKWNFFSYVKSDGNAGIATGTESEHSGDTKGYPGSEIYLSGKYMESKVNSDTRGVDYFLKFDPTVFELQASKSTDYYIDDVYYNPGTQMKHRMYYVAKKDGSGWDSDEEMDQTHEEDPDLRYYETMDALKGAGKTCIGVLFESRGQMAQDLDGLYKGYNYLFYAVKAKIRTSAIKACGNSAELKK